MLASVYIPVVVGGGATGNVVVCLTSLTVVPGVVP